MNRVPTGYEAQLIGDAIQLIREMNYDDEAQVLEWFYDDNDISVSDERDALAWTLQGSAELELFISPSLLNFDDKPCPVGLVRLASVLLHEARHIDDPRVKELPETERSDHLDALGVEITFCKKVRRDAQRLFPDANEDCLRSIRKAADERRADATMKRNALLFDD